MKTLSALLALCLSLLIAVPSKADEMPETCKLGHQAAMVGAFHLAIENYTRCLEQEPLTQEQRQKALNNRAAFYQMTNDTRKALADRDSVVALLPNRAASYVDRGQLKTEPLRDYRGAIADFDQALAIDPQSVNALLGRGLAFSALGDDDRALRDYDRAIQIDPSRTDALNRKADVFKSRGQYGEVSLLYDRILKLDREDTRALAGKAQLYRMQQRWPEAIESYGRAIAIDRKKGSPSAGINMIYRGDVYMEMGDLAAAVADFTQAMRIVPQVPWSYQRRAVAYERQGKTDLALADLQTAEARFKTMPELPFARGDLNCRLGRLAEARTAWSKAESLLKPGIQSQRIYRSRQAALQRTGFYEGRIDGKFGASSRAAEERWIAAACPAS